MVCSQSFGTVLVVLCHDDDDGGGIVIIDGDRRYDRRDAVMKYDVAAYASW